MRLIPGNKKDGGEWLNNSGKLVIGLLVLLLVGCVTVPPPSSVEKTGEAELAAHVRFLAQPSLKGRKPGTYGSRVAREYIESHFKAYGLVPWGSEKEYEQAFGYGKNVVGVLPGSDPNLAEEIVLVSAHYDHLGKHEGKIFYGAADNASGVAALLETAKHLSRARPKRTVAFAAFDCEERMLFGSFAFASRPDVIQAKISAVVNVDMLGRDMFDVVQNALFVTGAEGYPKIREEVRGYATEANIRIFPIGSDLIGPRSDHAAFEDRDIPCLFFSCGTFKDYHQPTDTAEKLNYVALERSANVIARTVSELADRSEMTKRDDATFYTEELQTVSTVLSEVVAKLEHENPVKWEPTDKPLGNITELRASMGVLFKQLDVASFRALQKSAEEHLRSGCYGWEARERLAVEAAGVLSPHFMPLGGLGEDDSQREGLIVTMKSLQLFYLNYRRDMLGGFRQLVEQILKHRPGAIRTMPRFAYELYDIADRDISFQEKGQNSYAFSALGHRLSLRSGSQPSRWFLNGFGLEFSFSLEPMDCVGTRDQVVDSCLLRARNVQTNTLRLVKMEKVLRRVTGADAAANYQVMLQQRLAQGNFGNETEWIVGCLQSGNPDLTLAAIGAARNSSDERCQKALKQLAIDRKSRPDVRAAAIESVGGNDGKTLLLFCDLLDDTNLIDQRESISILRDGYPFADREMLKIYKPMMEKQMKRTRDTSKTIRDLVLEKLKKATRQDFALDSARWREWIEGHFDVGFKRM